MAADASALGRDEEQADPVAVAPAAGGAGADHEMLRAVAMDDDGLAPVEHIALALAPGAGRDIEQIIARLRFGEGQRQPRAALDDAGDDPLLQRSRPAEPDRAARQHHGREIGLQRQPLAERLHHQQRLDRPAAEAALLLA